MEKEILIIEKKGAEEFEAALKEALNSNTVWELGGFSTCVDKEGNIVYSQVLINYPVMS